MWSWTKITYTIIKIKTSLQLYYISKRKNAKTEAITASSFFFSIVGGWCSWFSGTILWFSPICLGYVPIDDLEMWTAQQDQHHNKNRNTLLLMFKLWDLTKPSHDNLILLSRVWSPFWGGWLWLSCIFRWLFVFLSACSFRYWNTKRLILVMQTENSLINLQS